MVSAPIIFFVLLTAAFVYKIMQFLVLFRRKLGVFNIFSFFFTLLQDIVFVENCNFFVVSGKH